jgi:4,5-DOPA dioxygenase extradiol
MGIDTPRMPAAFLGHGNPMNALDDNRFTEAWRAFGASVPRPRAILVVSAHWYINATAVTAMATPKTIHDFYGFPGELFAVDYPAPGDPAVAQEIVDVVKPTWVGLDQDSWGIDHGSWSVLVHAFPQADIPVLQLSLNAQTSLEDHVAIGAKLAPLRDRGILVIGSGNVVHNLRRVDWGRPDHGFDWAHRFDEAACDLLCSQPGDAARLAEHPDFALAVPTPDHFVPVLYLAGLAAAADEACEVLVDARVMGSLSMTAYALGATAVTANDPGAGAPPPPADVPIDETNI